MRKQQVLIQQIIAVKRNNKEKWFIQNMTIKSCFQEQKSHDGFCLKSIVC